MSDEDSLIKIGDTDQRVLWYRRTYFLSVKSFLANRPALARTLPESTLLARTMTRSLFGRFCSSSTIVPRFQLLIIPEPDTLLLSNVCLSFDNTAEIGKNGRDTSLPRSRPCVLDNFVTALTGNVV